MARFAMKITGVTFVPMNGGSFLVEIRHCDSPLPPNDQASIDFETIIALNEPGGWNHFVQDVQEQRRAFVATLRRLANEGKRVVGYGAAAKCMTMLNYCGITPDLLPVIGDANPRKQGLLCPGVRIPVVSPGELLQPEPDYIMIGAWNLQAEIMRIFRELGYPGKFIVPLPVPRIVE
jgi:hypothetical protein